MEGIQVQLEYNGDGLLPHDIEVIMYRITQEILNNALKHAKATKATLSISCSKSQLLLYFSDNGIGFVPKAVVRGSGLTNIEDRCEIIGAELQLKSKPNEGTQIQISLNHSNKDNERSN
jgi:signal transduction histidine kinase